MNIAVFGVDYIGCVTAACLARLGHHVVAVDVQADRVGMINDGRPPIVEPGLGALLRSMVAEGRLRATTDVAEALRDACAALICVGTPAGSRGRPDVDAIDAIGQQIARALPDAAQTQPFTVVLRAAVLPGTIESVLQPALAAGLLNRPNVRVRVAMNPDFMREGSSIADFDEPPLILVGTDDPGAAALVRSMYVGVRAPFVHTSLRTAELAKYACDVFHSLKVGVANEIAELAESLGATGTEVMRVFAPDHALNIAGAYMRPRFAFSEPCLPNAVIDLTRIGVLPASRTPEEQTTWARAIVANAAVAVTRDAEPRLAARISRRLQDFCRSPGGRLRSGRAAHDGLP